MRPLHLPHLPTCLRRLAGPPPPGRRPLRERTNCCSGSPTTSTSFTPAGSDCSRHCMPTAILRDGRERRGPHDQNQKLLERHCEVQYLPLPASTLSSELARSLSAARPRARRLGSCSVVCSKEESRGSWCRHFREETWSPVLTHCLVVRRFDSRYSRIFPSRNIDVKPWILYVGIVYALWPERADAGKAR